MKLEHAPPLRALLAFEAAGRLGSFSEAADHLSITQSAVSQQIRKLEESVGQRLFVRRGTGVRLTAAGELLHDTVRTTLAQLEAGFDRIEPYRNADSVLVGCPADFARGWLAPRLGAFRAAQPAVEIWLITTRELREIDRIDVDLIVSRRPIHTADVECVPLLEDEAVAVCAGVLAPRLARMAFPAVLEKNPLLFLESDPDWGGLLRSEKMRRRRVSRAATIDDPVLLLESVEQGLGIGYVARVLATESLRAGRIAELPAVPRASRPRLWLMRTRLKPRTPVADLAFTWLREAAAGPKLPPSAPAPLPRAAR
jgi:LysR family glycine cleavage system transcriptional activator